MKSFIAFVAACAVTGFVVCHSLPAAEEANPKEITASPKKYVGRTVTIKVRFGKVNNVFRGWEDQANLNRKLKFRASPLAEIACYVNRTAENEKLIAGLNVGQEMTLTGYVKRSKIKARIKGDRRTVKRTVKGAAAYAFVVTKIESVGKVGAAGGNRRRMMRRMMKR
ncbi:MAG: hypothetical protein P8123_10465 [bacterium]